MLKTRPELLLLQIIIGSTNCNLQGAQPKECKILRINNLYIRQILFPQLTVLDVQETNILNIFLSSGNRLLNAYLFVIHGAL